MGFGPDNSKPEPNFNQVGWVEVPHEHRAHFSFSSSANWENAVCIYPEHGDHKLWEAGNHRRSLAPFNTEKNNTGQVQKFRVTGWHKIGPFPQSGRPWHLSNMKTDVDGLDSATLNTFGFQDQNHGFWKNMFVTVNIVHEH